MILLSFSSKDKKMKAAMFCLVLALFVAIEAAPVDIDEVETKIETRADGESKEEHHRIS